MEKRPLALFNKLVEKIQALANLHIIISSTWRKNLTVTELQEVFSDQAFSKFIFDKTPEVEGDFENWKSYCSEASHFDRRNPSDDIHTKIFTTVQKPYESLNQEDHQFLDLGFRCRASEIQEWIVNHPGYAGFIVIDDVDNHLSQNFNEKFISTSIHWSPPILRLHDTVKAHQIFLQTLNFESNENIEKELSVADHEIYPEWERECKWGDWG